jgi:hypothetical protein
MTKSTHIKNCQRLFHGVAPSLTLTTDPRRWARTLRFINQPRKVRDHAATSGRAVAKAVRRVQSKGEQHAS